MLQEVYLRPVRAGRHSKARIQTDLDTLGVNLEKNINVETALIWTMLSLMYLLTFDTVEPLGKLEFLWRFLAGQLNFVPGL